VQFDACRLVARLQPPLRLAQAAARRLLVDQALLGGGDRGCRQLRSAQGFTA